MSASSAAPRPDRITVQLHFGADGTAMISTDVELDNAQREFVADWLQAVRR